MEANKEAVFVYGLVKRQIITAGFGGEVIALNYEAINFTMNLYEIEDRRSCFEKVIWIFNYILKENKDKKQ